MGLFGGNKDDTKNKIEELKARMQQQHAPPPQQGGPQEQGWQQPQQPWQQPQQQYQAPEQPWQQQQQPQQAPARRKEPVHFHNDSDELGIVLDLGDGMSLNLPIRERMKLDEFLSVADRVRELKRIDHQQQH